MYKRNLENELLDASKMYPVVTVTGPRQSGKTTLVRACFPKKPYINLEEPDTRELAASDPRAFLQKYPDGAILDEIQRLPLLLSYMQSLVDARNQSGMFVLTGSHQLELSQAITQSLAGRTALLTLLPMSLQELRLAGFQLSLDEALLKGGYPRLFMHGMNPTKAYKNYFQTYVERDLRSLIQVKDLAQFQKFVYLAAGRIGQLINFESLGNEVGITANTVKHWLSILEASFVVKRLQPYHENFGKRVLKTAKLYFTDVGLATALLGIETAAQLERDPLRGQLVENLVYLELVKARLNQGLDPELYFFKDATGHEVDFLFKKGHELIPIEVKSSMTFNSSFLRGLHYFEKIASGRALKGSVIYGGDEELFGDKFNLIPFYKCAQLLQGQAFE